MAVMIKTAQMRKYPKHSFRKTKYNVKSSSAPLAKADKSTVKRESISVPPSSEI